MKFVVVVKKEQQPLLLAPAVVIVLHRLLKSKNNKDRKVFNELSFYSVAYITHLMSDPEGNSPDGQQCAFHWTGLY